MPAELPIAPVETAVEEPARAPMWELAECNCPDFCDRDHEQD